MPALVQNIMLLAPTTHFVSLAQAVLFRGAGISIVWGQFVLIFAIGLLFSSRRFGGSVELLGKWHEF